MIRFSFSLRRCGKRRLGTIAASRGMLRDIAHGHTPEPRGGSRGPGWFDSSWDLIHGLEVREWPLGSTLAERDEQPGARLVPPAPHGAFVDALQLGDLDLAVAAEITHLDQFGEFGIDGLELV